MPVDRLLAVSVAAIDSGLDTSRGTTARQQINNNNPTLHSIKTRCPYDLEIHRLYHLPYYKRKISRQHFGVNSLYRQRGMFPFPTIILSPALDHPGKSVYRYTSYFILQLNAERFHDDLEWDSLPCSTFQIPSTESMTPRMISIAGNDHAGQTYKDGILGRSQPLPLTISYTSHPRCLYNGLQTYYSSQRH